MLHAKIIDIKKEKIEVNKAEDFISSSKFGASLIFKGTVRETNENKKVTGKRRKVIKESSNAGRVDSRESVERTSYQVVKGVSAKGIKAPKKERANIRSSFVQLQGLLNAKLPETVAANMGAPRLENRTGTFASSVRVTEIQTTRQGFASIGYTYQKDPYSVFENTSGTRFASAERDPRKLIDKSMREVAVNLAIGRFYTRRQ